MKPIVDMISPASVSRYLLCHIIQHIYCLDIHTAALCRDSGQLPSECTQASPALVTGKQERIILVFCTFSILTVTCSLVFYQTVETHSLLHSMLQSNEVQPYFISSLVVEAKDEVIVRGQVWKVSIIIFAEAIPFSVGRKFKVLVHLNSFVGHFTHICGAGVNTDTTALIGDKKVQIRCGWADSGHLSSCSLVRHDGSLVVMRLVVTSETREKLLLSTAQLHHHTADMQAMCDDVRQWRVQYSFLYHPPRRSHNL